MNNPDEELQFVPRPREQETIPLVLPKTALESLAKVAEHKDMSVEALIRFYIGQSLRQDLTKLFADRVLEVTAKVLAEHLESEQEVSAIIQNIRSEVSW